MNKILALILALSIATPAAAEDDFIKLLGAIIAGAAIADALDHNHDRKHHSGHYKHHSGHYKYAPSPAGRNPNVSCYTRAEYRHNWVITRWYNCYDQVIRVERRRRH